MRIPRSHSLHSPLQRSSSIWIRRAAPRDPTGLPPPAADFWSNAVAHIERLNACENLTRLRRIIQREINPLPGMQIFEGGCGPGHLAVELAKQGAHVYAVDKAEHMFLAAQARAQTSCDTAALSRLTFCHEGVLPALQNLGPDSVDVVALNLVLPFVQAPDRLLVLEQAFRVLRPGGKLVMLNPTPGTNFLERLVINLWLRLANPLTYLDLKQHIYPGLEIQRRVRRGVWNFFTRPQTQDMLAMAGFQPEHVHVSHPWPSETYFSVAIKHGAEISMDGIVDARAILAKTPKPHRRAMRKFIARFNRFYALVRQGNQALHLINAQMPPSDEERKIPDIILPQIVQAFLEMFREKGRPWVSILPENAADVCSDLIDHLHATWTDAGKKSVREFLFDVGVGILKNPAKRKDLAQTLEDHGRLLEKASDEIQQTSQTLVRIAGAINRNFWLQGTIHTP